MCQAAPGPRCANRVRNYLTAAEDKLTAATAAKNDADAAFAVASSALRNRPRKRVTGYLANQDESDEALAYQAAMRARAEATQAHREAEAKVQSLKAEYDTTPEGQKKIEAEVARLRETGDAAGADAEQARLDQAVAVRMEKEAALEESRAHAQRLKDLTVTESAKLDQLDAAVADTGRKVIDAEDQVADLQKQCDALEKPLNEAAKTHSTALAVVKQQQQQIIDAQKEAYTEAKRLYMEAGVSEKFAGYYASDTVKAAQNVRGDRYSDQGFARRPLKLKVKASGPDVDKTKAAAAAAKTDDRFRAANTKLAMTIESHATVAAAEAEGPRRDLDALYNQRGTLQRDLQEAQGTLAAARARHEQWTGTAQRTRAQIAVGAGLTAEPVNLQQARDEIVRQPDGSTNAYVYEAPSDGFPHGRYRRVVGVATVHGMGSANGLVLDNGKTVNASEHYSRGYHGPRTNKHNPSGVIITPAQPGSHPLRIEAVPEAGYATFIDSTD